MTQRTLFLEEVGLMNTDPPIGFPSTLVTGLFMDFLPAREEAEGIGDRTGALLSTLLLSAFVEALREELREVLTRSGAALASVLFPSFPLLLSFLLFRDGTSPPLLLDVCPYTTTQQIVSMAMFVFAELTTAFIIIISDVEKPVGSKFGFYRFTESL